VQTLHGFRGLGTGTLWVLEGGKKGGGTGKEGVVGLLGNGECEFGLAYWGG